jgi:hypothetical protein
MARRAAAITLVLVLLLAAGVIAWTIVSRGYAPRNTPAAPAEPQAAAPAVAERKIKATLYFVSEAGL